MPFVFSEADVAAFATASGDRNPLHVDRSYARTTPFGECVVHGALLAIAALGRLGDATLAGVRAVDVSFGGAVVVGEPVEAQVKAAPGGDAWQVRLTGRGRLLARVVARRDASDGAGAVPAPARPMRTEPFDLPALPEVGETVAGAYAAEASLSAIASMLGAGALAPALLEALAWASYVVGMEMPGRHGVFGAVKLAAGEGGSGAGAYAIRVAERDPRTDHLVLTGAFEPAGGGRVAASIECFARPAVPAIDAGVLTGSRAEPTGRAVVVIGGSRGFGAATALALLARGHETHVVHSSAAASLDGGLRAHVADARDAKAMAEVAAAVAERGLPLHGIVLAASPPPLPMAVTAESADAVAAYVAQALSLAAAPLGALLPLLERDGWVVFCSSTAVSAPPRDWPHYVAAKGALEGLASWTAAATPGVRSVAARLPKMLTAMTNSPSMRVNAAAPEPVALRLVELLESNRLAAGFTVVEEELA